MALHVLGAAGTFVFTKTAAEAFSDAAALTMARAGGAVVVFLLLTGWALPRPRFSPLEWLEVAALGMLLIWGNQYLFVRGLQQALPSHAALLYALTPLGVLLASCLLERRLPGARRLFGVSLALAGVVVLLRPWETQGEVREHRAGDLWILSAVVGWILYTVLARGLCRRHDPRSVTAWCLILGGLGFLPWGLPALLDFPLQSLSGKAWFGLVWLILVTSVGMMLLWNALLRYLHPVEVAICTNAQPLATALLAASLAAVGFLDSDQGLGVPFWAGMLLVMSGVVLVQLGAGNKVRTEGNTPTR